jgi:hypothetical protein
MVVACLALTVALTGASYAAVVLPRTSVGTPQLKANAVKSAKVAPNAIKGVDVAEATLGTVPSANLANSAASATNAANADNLDGLDSGSFWKKTDDVQVAPVSGSYSLPSIALVSGTTHRLAAGFTATSDGLCLVRAESATFAGAGNASGFHQVRTARRVNGGAIENDGGWNNYVMPRGVDMGTGGKSHVWPITAGNTYEFGVSMSATGDFVGDTAYPSLSYICF